MIPGFIISLATFPGIMVHEFAHKFFADRSGVLVHKVCYFRLGNPAGYVIHDPAVNLKQSFLISIGPLIVNTVLCALIASPVMFPEGYLTLGISDNLTLFIGWLGLSIGMHAFPSNQDMSNFLSDIKKTKGHSLLLLVSRAFAVLLRISNLLRFFWFDLIYAVGVSMLLPWIVMNFYK
ncbi:MAG: metalloprotease family protein [Candidatus Peregrinibacteria bacterium]